MEEWKPCFIRTDLLLVCLASPDQWNREWDNKANGFSLVFIGLPTLYQASPSLATLALLNTELHEYGITFLFVFYH